MTDCTADRGVSEVIGYVLVFSLILSSVAVISVAGVNSLEEVESAQAAENAQTAFEVLDSNMAQLYTEHSPSRATEMDIGDAELLTGENVTVRLHLDNGSSWDNTTIYQVRPVVQRLEDQRRVVYEVGAVFRTNRDTGIMLEEPPILSREDTIHITVPATQSTTTSSVGGGTALVRGSVTDRDVVVRDTGGTYNEVVYNVTSPRADLWHDHLEEEGFDCTDPGDDTTECSRDSFTRLYVSVHEIDLTLVR